MSVFLLLVGFFVSVGWFFFANINLEKQAQNYIQTTLSEQLGVDFKFKKVVFDWSRLMKLKPSLSIENIQVGNPKQFSDSKMLDIEKVYMDLHLRPLLKKRVEFKKIILEKPKVILEVNNQSKLNLLVLVDALGHGSDKSKKDKKKKDSKEKDKSKDDDSEGEALIEKIHLDEFLIKSGTFDFYDYGTKKLKLFSSRDMNLKLKKLVINEIDKDPKLEADVDLSMKFFNSKEPNFKYKGKIGDLNNSKGIQDSIKSSGDLTTYLYMADIPKPVYEKLLGELPLIENKDSKVDLQASLDGDLMNNIYGKGTLKLDKFIVGKNKKRNVKINAKFPAKLVSNLLKKETLSISTEKSQISLQRGGDLEIAGDFNFDFKSQYLNGQSNGNLKGLDINYLLSTFTDFEDKLFGKFEIPNFEFSFAGANSEQLEKSLKGKGNIQVTEGRLYLLDKIIKVKDKVFDSDITVKITEFLEKKVGDKVEKYKDKVEIVEKTSSSKSKQKDNETKFSKLVSDFRVLDERVYTDNLLIETPLANVRGNGYMKFNQRMKFDLELVINDGVLPFKLRGTAEDPKVSIDTKKISKESSTKLINEALNFGFQELQRRMENIEIKQVPSKSKKEQSVPSKNSSPQNKEEPGTEEASE